MFNGIIYNTGIVTRIAKLKNSLEITLKTKMKFNKYEIGSSVCCNGTCLTLTKVNKNLITFYLSRETLNKTNFKYIKNKHLINLEKSLSYGTKVSGHYVQGHTDTTAKIINIEVVDKTWIIKLVVTNVYSRLCMSMVTVFHHHYFLMFQSFVVYKMDIFPFRHYHFGKNLYSPPPPPPHHRHYSYY